MDKIDLHSERLQIRHLALSDLDDFLIYRSDPDVAKYQGYDPMTAAQAEAFIRENEARRFGKAGEWVQYGIEEKSSAKLIGDCAMKLDADDPRNAETGITISPPWQRKGYARETMLRLLSFLFDDQNVNCIVERVHIENLASVQLLQRIGFKQEGRIKIRGENEYRYALSKQEWIDNPTRP